MEEKEILLKAFNIMVSNYEKDWDICEQLNNCGECPFKFWLVCPKCVSK